MSTKTFNTARNSLALQTLISALVLAIGVALLVYMIKVEGEPGALPLLTVIVSIAWLAITRFRARALRTA